jgi:SAM-dependent methyltransferase
VGTDWSDGDYGRTANRLEPVARLVVARVGIAAGQRVLDVGCGTGNASIAAARGGAAVTGVDPAAGLLAIADRRASEAGLDITFLHGDAQELEQTGDFDVVLSVFAVIFAEDAAAAVRGMIGAARVGGTIALTSWLPEGAMDAMARVLRNALPAADGPPNRWDEPRWIEELLIACGAGRVAMDREQIMFRAESPEAMWAETEEFHPFWRWARRELPEERWDLVRHESIAALRDGNEDPAAFAATSSYVLVQTTR